MLTAINAYVRMLAQSQAIGLFYFSGHGTQLAWRNYLLPVDAEIRKPDDIPARGVDLNALMQGLGRASNPMNIVILDACRDNPFGRSLPGEQKGLSQFDAPPGSLLAYATSPGNTASDGSGVNGLYTEHLLHEISAPDTRIEDVFKRVRLAVRRRSNGQQIPWESTSLEEDFYLRPSPATGTLPDPKGTQRYEEELVLWGRLRADADPAAFEDCLRRYPPSGLFSELAQLRLDHLLAQRGERRIEIASHDQNPYSKGHTRADTRFKIGDRYSYRQLDLTTNQEMRRYTLVVSELSDTQVIFNNGTFITDRSHRQSRPARRRDALHRCPAPDRRLQPRQEVDRPPSADEAQRCDFRFTDRLSRRRQGERHTAGRHLRSIPGRRDRLESGREVRSQRIQPVLDLARSEAHRRP